MQFEKTILAILLPLFLLSSTATAQQTFEIEGTYMMSSEKLTPNRSKVFNNDQSHHSFGINGRIIFNSNFFITTGLQYRQFGTSFQKDEKNAESTELVTTWSANRVDIPMNVGYYFIKTNKLRVGAALGLSNGIVFDQSQSTEGKVSDLDVYQNFMMNYNASLEIGIQLQDRIVLNITPIWQRQLNVNFSEYRSYQQVALGGQVGISYQIGKIEPTEETTEF